MISYEEALEIAREMKPNIDNCTEYKTVYVFSAHEDDNYIGGYGHSPIAVMKEDGRLSTMLELDVVGCGEVIRIVELY